MTGNRLLDSLPNLRHSLSNPKDLPISTSFYSSPSKANNTSPRPRGSSDYNATETREAVADDSYCSGTDNRSPQQTINYQDFWSISAGLEENSVEQLPAILQKPDSNDALHIALALAESKDFLRGPHEAEYFLNYNPPLHPVMLASHSLKGTVQKSSREGRRRMSGELSQPSSSGDTSSFDAFLGGSIQGTNYQRLMEEMRNRKKSEMEGRGNDQDNAKKHSMLRKSQTPKFNNVKIRRPKTEKTPATSSKMSNENENDLPARKRALSIIDEDESSETETNSDCPQSDCVDISGSNSSPCKPPETSNTLCVPGQKEQINDMKDMDPLIKLLYQEIAEANGDTNRQPCPTDPTKGGGGWEVEEEETEEDIALGRQLIERMRTAMVKRQLTKNDMRLSKKSDSVDDKNSILIAPPDVQMLLKAAEFRGKSLKLSLMIAWNVTYNCVANCDVHLQ